MRNLPQEAINELHNKSDIRPCYLIEITLDKKYYFSTRQQYESASHTYEPGHVQNLRLSRDSVQFGVVNADYTHTTPALMGDYQRSPVKVFWSSGFPPVPLIQHGYVMDGYYIEDGRPEPTLLFDGNIYQFTQITTVLGIKATRSAVRSYPKVRVLPPLANFVRKQGAIIEFGNNVLRLQPR